MLIDEKQVINHLKKASMSALYKAAYECIDNEKAYRYPYIVKEVFNRYMANKITAIEFKEFNSKVAKRPSDPKKFSL